jgi:hypothetical protein
MKLLINDEIKIYPAKKNSLFFGTIEGVGRLLKQRGTVLEADYSKQRKCWTYFVEFNSDLEQRYWFEEDEIYLI